MRIIRTLGLILGLILSVGAQDFERRTPVVIAVEKVGPAVVNIQCQQRTSSTHRFLPGLFAAPEAERDPDTGQLYANTELGAGVIVHSDGIIVTNEHVIHSAERLVITFSDGSKRTATLVNSNSDSDLAVLRINEPGTYTSASFGDSDKLLIGETTIALGNPFGLGSSATVGILSAVNRQVLFQEKPVFKDFLQTSADINPGNSGGPLLDINGRIIGINTAIRKEANGIGFAIPVNRVRSTIEEMLSPELASGVTVGVEAAATAGVVTAGALAPKGAAERAGLRQGDQLLSVNGKRVASLLDLHVALLAVKPGDEVMVQARRDSSTKSFKLEAVGIERRFGTVLFGMEIADMSRKLAEHLGNRLPSNLPDGVPVVVRVEDQSAAQRVGFQTGDVLVAVERFDVRNTSGFISALTHYQRRGSARVRLWRGGKLFEGTLKLEARDG